jgi:hypothetical protein
MGFNATLNNTSVILVVVSFIEGGGEAEVIREKH